MAKKTARVELRITPEEKEKLVLLASLAGVSITEYLIGRAIGDKFAQVLLDSFFNPSK